jgi:restriction system protein
MKKDEGRRNFLAALNRHRKTSEENSAEETKRRHLLEREHEAFRHANEEFLASQRAASARVDALRVAWFRKEVDAVVEQTDLVLNNSKYPNWMKLDFTAAYEANGGSLVIDYRLPAPDELPTLERVTFIKSRNEKAEKYIPEARRKKLFDSVCYQIALRTLHELFEADEAQALSSITFNGWVEATNPSTGHIERNCILSVQAEKSEFLTFDLDKVDPKACFKTLKGVAASSLIGLAPVRPILRLLTDDPRFIAPREIVDALDDSSNLASMPWEDFEHLVRELFSQVFSSAGSEVHVTQASRDGGVDAVALDPDPIKGGKIVIQAKRYTNTVGVGAVRDLYGTVMNEGANRGILVTTSDFGPDAYRFAQGKPLTLLNGSNLLSLLADYGHRARIDLREAKLQQRAD